jgi:hypothetical protein
VELLSFLRPDKEWPYLPEANTNRDRTSTNPSMALLRLSKSSTLDNYGMNWFLWHPNDGFKPGKTS